MFSSVEAEVAGLAVQFIFISMFICCCLMFTQALSDSTNHVEGDNLAIKIRK